MNTTGVKWEIVGWSLYFHEQEESSWYQDVVEQSAVPQLKDVYKPNLKSSYTKHTGLFLTLQSVKWQALNVLFRSVLSVVLLSWLPPGCSVLFSPPASVSPSTRNIALRKTLRKANDATRIMSDGFTLYIHRQLLQFAFATPELVCLLPYINSLPTFGTWSLSVCMGCATFWLKQHFSTLNCLVALACVCGGVCVHTSAQGIILKMHISVRVGVNKHDLRYVFCSFRVLSLTL